MRIIAGDLKGRQVKAVKGKETRPTSNMIKEAVFHKMGPFFDGGKGLDLFAGSGSLGIEAISRGYESMVLIDQSKQAIKTIKDNTTTLGVKARCEIYQNDAFRALDILLKKGQTFSLILLDPPYELTTYQALVNDILDKDLLDKGGFLYIEHSPSETLDYPANLEEIFNKKYTNTTAVTILQHI